MHFYYRGSQKYFCRFSRRTQSLTEDSYNRQRAEERNPGAITQLQLTHRRTSDVLLGLFQLGHTTCCTLRHPCPVLHINLYLLWLNLLWHGLKLIVILSPPFSPLRIKYYYSDVSDCNHCWRCLGKACVCLKSGIQIKATSCSDVLGIYLFHLKTQKQVPTCSLPTIFLFVCLFRDKRTAGMLHGLPLAVAISPSGWAMRCIAVAPTQMGMLIFCPKTEVDRSITDTSLSTRGYSFHLTNK